MASYREIRNLALTGPRTQVYQDGQTYCATCEEHNVKLTSRGAPRCTHPHCGLRNILKRSKIARRMAQHPTIGAGSFRPPPKGTVSDV